MGQKYKSQYFRVVERAYVELSDEVIQQLQALGYGFIAADLYGELNADEVLGPGASAFYKDVILMELIPLHKDFVADEDDYVPLDQWQKLFDLVSDETHWLFMDAKYLKPFT